MTRIVTMDCYFCGRNLKYQNMRLEISTSPSMTPFPFNYQQKLTGVLHKWLGENNQEHGEISLYSFSWLQNTMVGKDGLSCPKGANWFISFYDDQRAKDVLAHIRTNPELFCGMYVEEVSIMETPSFSNRELFFLGSPILIKRLENGKTIEYGYENPESGKMLVETLRTKMKKAGLPDDKTLRIEFDMSYEKKKKKLVWYDGISSKANMCPVIIQGDNSTKQFAWNVGIGNCTGIGFGSIY